MYRYIKNLKKRIRETRKYVSSYQPQLLSHLLRYLQNSNWYILRKGSTVRMESIKYLHDLVVTPETLKSRSNSVKYVDL